MQSLGRFVGRGTRLAFSFQEQPQAAACLGFVCLNDQRHDLFEAGFGPG